MARRVQGPPPGKEAWYTPTALGNADAPLEDRVRVKICYPTQGDQARVTSRVAVMEMDAAEASIGDGKIRVTGGTVEAIKSALLGEFVAGVEGYEDGAGKPIVDGAGLYEHGDRPIVNEVWVEITTALSLTAEEKKTSDESRDSQPLTPGPSLGTAENAGELVLTVSADTIEIAPTSLR